MKEYIALRLSKEWIPQVGFAGWGAFIGRGWRKPRYYLWCHPIAPSSWQSWWNPLYFLDGEVSDDYLMEQVLADSPACTEFGSAEELQEALRLLSERDFRKEYGLSKRQADKLLGIQAPAGGKLSEEQIEALRWLLEVKEVEEEE